MKKEKIATAKRMLKQKISLDIIVLSTQLTKEEIEKIKSEMEL